MAKLSKFQKEINDRELNSQIQFHMESEGRNLFQSEVRRRHAMSNNGKKIAALTVILAVLYFLSMTVVPWGVFGVSNGLPYFGGTAAGWHRTIVSQFAETFSMVQGIAGWRLAGFASVFLSGMAMACAGSVYQGVFQNPMASPTTLGVYAGGTLGGIVYILFLWDSTFYAEHLEIEKVGNSMYYVWAATASEIQQYYESMTVWQRYGLNIGTFVGCFVGVALIVGISTLVGKGKISTVTLMLAGSIFSTVINQLGQTVQYAIIYNNPPELEDARVVALDNLLGGSTTLSALMRLDNFLLAAIPIGICLVILFAMSGKLNILMFGAEEAEAMGVPVRRFRNILIVCCTVLSGITMCFCGQVAMLGFLMPHLARFLVGPNFKALLPASALMGGICCLLVWDFCYMTANTGGFNTSVSVVCSILSVLFIILYRRNRHADWS